MFDKILTSSFQLLIHYRLPLSLTESRIIWRNLGETVFDFRVTRFNRTLNFPEKSVYEIEYLLTSVEVCSI